MVSGASVPVFMIKRSACLTKLRTRPTCAAARFTRSRNASMACTAAVEQEIDRHYTAQLDRLAQDRATGDADPELEGMIERFRDDEREHHDAAIAAGAERAPAYPLLHAAIRFGCRAAIRLSERI